MSTPEKLSNHSRSEESKNKITITKTLLIFLKEYYASIAAVLLLFFSGYSLFIGVAYYQNFGIEITYFSNYLDIYRAAFSNKTWISLGKNVFIVVVSVGTSILYFKFANRKEIESTLIEVPFERTKKIGPHSRWQKLRKKASLIRDWLIPRSVFFLTSIYLLIHLSFKLSLELSNRTNAIRVGIVNIYDVKTIDTTYKCHAMIGASSDYLFLWNYRTKESTIIPKIKINEIKLVHMQPPDQHIPRTLFSSKEESGKAVSEVREESRIWAQKRISICRDHILPT